MNFLSLLKNKHRYDAAFVIINRFSKCFYSLSCIKKITTKNMIRLYIIYIYQIYKFSNIIVSDHDFQFILNFWKKFCKILNTKLKLLTAHHFQTNSQIKIINQHITQHLCFYINYYQNDWSELLSIMNFVAIILFHELTDFFFSKWSLIMNYKSFLTESFMWNQIQ